MKDVSQFIYRIQPTRSEMLSEGPTDLESKAIGEHFDYLQGLADAGVVLLAGRTLTTNPEAFGLVILGSMSAADAREIMQNDPAVVHGIMHAELYPYRIAIVSEQIAAQEE